MSALASTKLTKVILARHPAAKSVLATLRLVRASKAQAGTDTRPCKLSCLAQAYLA